MAFEVLCAESLGVRSLAVWVPDAPQGGLLIDPGAALGPRRQGFPPHRQEEKALAAALQRLAETAPRARRVVITHFHHDHFVPYEERQWIASGAELADHIYVGKIVYLRDRRGKMNRRQRLRRKRITTELARRGIRTEPMDDRRCEDLCFSPPLRHGDDASPGGWVVLVAVETTTGRLVHMSDTQLLNDEAVVWTLGHQPTIVVTSGPPLYLPQLRGEQRERARSNLRRLVEQVPWVVLDHHVRRGGDIEGFLDEATALAVTRGHRLESAAAVQGRADDLLESRRRELYEPS
jgi:predicted metallo-beta-lactamase superfamily hydrolase